MKPTTLLLCASLLANVAFLSYSVTRVPPSAHAAKPNRPTASSANTGDADTLRAALASGDAAALQAAGLTPELAREIAAARQLARAAARIRATKAQVAGDDRWWRSRPGNPAEREQQLALRRELSDALVAAFGDDLGLGGAESAQWAFLSPAKRDALRRITQDYDEMMAKFSASGVQLPSDREKLRLLRQERDRDIAALLTPEERIAYEMRTSPSANTVRSRYGDAIESESEFQKLYALQKAFDEKYPREALVGRISPETLRARSDAERELERDMRAAVGDDRFAALRRAADSDARTIESLASRLNLPATTTDAVITSRDSYAAESQRIANNAALSVPERRAQLQSLATQAKSDLSRALGAEAAEAYAQRSPWVSLLQNGMAYSTTPQAGTPASLMPGGQSVYPVSPAGVGGGGQRQVVINAAPAELHGGGDEPVGAGNLRVMTFSTTEQTTTGTPVRGPADAAPRPATPPTSSAGPTTHP